MRKITAVILAAMMLLTLMTACGKEENVPQEKSATDTTVTTTTTAPTIPVVPKEQGDYKLVWNDEFVGDEINFDDWRFEYHPPRFTNNELQEYTGDSANAFVRDGKLVIKAIKTVEYGSAHYSSAKLTTMKKHDFTYGRIAVSAKVPEGQGLWPAIWMMPTSTANYGQWPKGGEIDILEVLGHDVDTAYGTIHYGDPHAQQQGTYNLTGGETFANGFHEFRVDWEPGEFRYYIDGNLYATFNDWFTAVGGGEPKPFPAPFDQDFYLQLNLAVGGTWPGDPDETTDFDKAEFEVDYVRVYQKESYDTNVTKPTQSFRDADAEGNFIRNGKFENAESLDDDIDWKFMVFSGGVGSAEIKDGTMIVTTENEGSVDYAIQLVQSELPMMQGKKYRVSFDAWADENRDIIVTVSAPNSNYDRYLPDALIGITAEKKTYTAEFDMTRQDDNNGRLEFDMGNKGSTATVYIQNVKVEQIG